MIEIAYLDYRTMRDWKLTGDESLLMAIFSNLEKYSSNKLDYDGTMYHILKRRDILNELPILESTSCIKRGIIGLEKKGIIKSISVPDVNYTHYAYVLTEKGKNWKCPSNGGES